MKDEEDKKTTNNELYMACVILRWPEIKGNQELAIKTILAHPKIQKHIKQESRQYSSRNKEIQPQDLHRDIETILYMAIRNEFRQNCEIDKIQSWLCSRITWRTRDFLTKEFDLIYTKRDNEDKPSYTRRKKIPIVKIGFKINNNSEIEELIEASKHSTVSEDNDLKDFQPTYITFDQFLRRSPLKVKDKQVLMMKHIMGYSYSEMSDYFGVSSATAHKWHEKAKNSLQTHINSLSSSLRSHILELIERIK